MIIYNIISFISYAANIYIGLLAIYALLSWFPGAYDSTIGRLISRICEPYLSLFDRFNLSIGGIGFSIIIAIFVLRMGVTILSRLLLTIAY
ncbi:YggT family protein [uncultured Vagococcus sp.]|uniref:YggT family protein n=1 Tax=uncultured Vagococcus sp. TaxID=189676 RepID=UPI0028D7EECB|nr:YggT family protein [uncultured Vagococcus sp.]